MPGPQLHSKTPRRTLRLIDETRLCLLESSTAVFEWPQSFCDPSCADGKLCDVARCRWIKDEAPQCVRIIFCRLIPKTACTHIYVVCLDLAEQAFLSSAHKKLNSPDLVADLCSAWLSSGTITCLLSSGDLNAVKGRYKHKYADLDFQKCSKHTGNAMHRRCFQVH